MDGGCFKVDGDEWNDRNDVGVLCAEVEELRLPGCKYVTNAE